VEQLERATLAQVALLPHMDEKDRKQVGSFEEVRAEFDRWLMAEPEEMTMTAEDLEQAQLYRLLGVGQGR
jgi:hypothetical protein